MTFKKNESQFYSNSPKFIPNMLLLKMYATLYLMVIVYFFFFLFSFFYNNSLVEVRILCCPVRSLWLTIPAWFLFNTHGQHLASTKQTFLSFQLLDDKRELTDTLYHTAQSRIHLGIQPCISYQTHNPSLSFFWGLIPLICCDINIERRNKNSQM